MEISSKKQLAVILSQLKGFEQPDPCLEQYPTEADIAAEILWFAFYRREIEGKTVADLGCGTGLLGLSTLLLGAKKVFFVDIDEKSIEIAKENLAFLEKKLDVKLKQKAVFVVKDVKDLDEKVDLIVQNPPFGVKVKHADKVFLEKAFELAPVIYSFHKIESVNFISKFSDEKNYKITHFWSFDWPLKMTMKYHKKKIQYIKVGCWRLERKSFGLRPNRLGM
jgi:putative methylase